MNLPVLSSKSRPITVLLFAFFSLAVTFVALGQRTEPVALKKGAQAPSSKTVRSYQDVLSQVPDELRNVHPKEWTRAQREEANTAFKVSLTDSETPAKIHLTVFDIPNWRGWTIYCDIPNQEGYFIRVFGKFNDAWTEKFRALKRGDTVLLEGVLRAVMYENLWGKFTLSICLKDCTFTKTNEPGIKL